MQEKERNQSIIELDNQGVSRADIARQFHISRQRVLQICGAKYKPGNQGRSSIPEADIPNLKLQLAKCEISIEDVMQKYGVSRKYGYFKLSGYKRIREELGLYKCRICKKLHTASEMTHIYPNTCRSCNDDMAVERYRRLRQEPKDGVVCDRCGQLVSAHHLAQLNHNKWHGRVDSCR